MFSGVKLIVSIKLEYCKILKYIPNINYYYSTSERIPALKIPLYLYTIFYIKRNAISICQERKKNLEKRSVF